MKYFLMLWLYLQLDNWWNHNSERGGYLGTIFWNFSSQINVMVYSMIVFIYLYNTNRKNTNIYIYTYIFFRQKTWKIKHSVPSQQSTSKMTARKLLRCFHFSFIKNCLGWEGLTLSSFLAVINWKSCRILLLTIIIINPCCWKKS